MPGKLVLSTTPFSCPQFVDLFPSRTCSHTCISQQVFRKTTPRVLQGQWARNSHWRAVSIKQRPCQARITRCLRALSEVEQYWTRSSSYGANRTDCACCVHITSAWHSASCQADWSCPSSLKKEFPSPSHPLLLHCKWQHNGHHEKTQNSLLTWPKQPLKWEDQRKNTTCEANH